MVMAGLLLFEKCHRALLMENLKSRDDI